MSARRHTRSRAVSSTATPRSTSRAYRSVREQERGGRGLEQVASDAAEQCFAEARPAKGAHDDEPGRDVLRHLLERSEEHTSELQSLMRISYAVFCLKKTKKHTKS